MQMCSHGHLSIYLLQLRAKILRSYSVIYWLFRNCLNFSTVRQLPRTTPHTVYAYLAVIFPQCFWQSIPCLAKLAQLCSFFSCSYNFVLTNLVCSHLSALKSVKYLKFESSSLWKWSSHSVHLSVGQSIIFEVKIC